MTDAEEIEEMMQRMREAGRRAGAELKARRDRAFVEEMRGPMKKHAAEIAAIAPESGVTAEEIKAICWANIGLVYGIDPAMLPVPEERSITTSAERHRAYEKELAEARQDFADAILSPMVAALPCEGIERGVAVHWHGEPECGTGEADTPVLVGITKEGIADGSITVAALPAPEDDWPRIVDESEGHDFNVGLASADGQASCCPKCNRAEGVEVVTIGALGCDGKFIYRADHAKCACGWHGFAEDLKKEA